MFVQSETFLHVLGSTLMFVQSETFLHVLGSTLMFVQSEMSLFLMSTLSLHSDPKVPGSQTKIEESFWNTKAKKTALVF